MYLKHRRLLARDRGTVLDSFTPTPRVFLRDEGACRLCHSKGLKLGIYSDAGNNNVRRAVPGAGGHEYQDALTYAQWGSIT